MKSPAFQFYPADYLADMKLRMLSWASRGLYMDLLCYCWREGYIPSDSSAIAQLCGCHDLAIVEPCLSLFVPHENDPEKLVHTRLIAEKEKQKSFSENRKTSGIKGAEARWKGKKHENGSAIVLPMAKNGSSSSSSSSSSDNNPLPLKGNGKKRSKASNPKITRVEQNTETMSRINSWFGRRPETLWTIAERDALDAINPTGPEVVGMEIFYTADDSEDAPLYRRSNLITLLNNWPSELDKARGYARKMKGSAQ